MSFAQVLPFLQGPAQILPLISTVNGRAQSPVPSPHFVSPLPSFHSQALDKVACISI